ncbi:MAG TPA: bifunctional sulfate adenylyltransferase/adenylylsulfate kinase, partial [Candidatus Saccharimonadales bacterium]|nr:bifunctional sulfate adenylyltransferase/adenylylsulfate kinase [Candidatus Saccharimonadales bacterium]
TWHGTTQETRRKHKSMNEPHGGKLIDLMVSPEKAKTYKKDIQSLPRWTLTMRQACDFELLSNGGFSPLTGFMDEPTYLSVCKDMRLPGSNLVWPMPITLDVTAEFAKSLKPAQKVVLEDAEGVALGILTVKDIYKPDKKAEAEWVFKTTDTAHPGVNYLFNQAGEYYLGGDIEALALPHHYDFVDLRLTPKELRERFKKLGWQKIVAFQTRNPMHRAHVELTLRACADNAMNLLINPTVGMTKPGDVDHYTRVRVYKHILDKYPPSTATLSLLPLAMRMGGPREALWHSIIRKNYGATHFIIGRDHAGPGKDSNGNDIYGPYESQQLAEKYAPEIGVEIVPFQMMVYVPKLDRYKPVDELAEGEEHQTLSGTELRALLNTGKELPSWFTYPEVAAELRRSYKPRKERGFVVFFTGLSGSGKSTLAKGLLSRLHETGGRTITLLDGDEVRRHLSSELTFSKEHRDLNIKRIGYVAAEIAKHGGIAICAPIAPYESLRQEVRRMAESCGAGFIEVYVNTPLEVCEQRDRKGLYAAARAGKIKNFTGISDPYEPPKNPEFVADTTTSTREELVQSILLAIENAGYL